MKKVNSLLGIVVLAFMTITQAHATTPEVDIVGWQTITHYSGSVATNHVTRTGDVSSALSVPFLLSGTAVPTSYRINVTNTIDFAAGQSATNVYIAATNDGSYQDGTVIITLQDNGLGQYTVGSQYSVTNTVLEPCGTVAAALTNLTSCPGTSATFVEAASGTGPFTFVWRKDGNVLGGETSSAITIASVSDPDVGTYTCEVTGSCSNVTNSATLALAPTTTATALSDLIVCPGQPAQFSTIPSGTGPFTYQWRKDGVVQNSTSNSLVINAATDADGGTYSVEVTGACTSVTNSASLALNQAAAATALTDAVANVGDSASFSTSASGTGPFTYAWTKNGQPINGQTTSAITLTNLAVGDAGTYNVHVTGACGSVNQSATLVVHQVTPEIVVNPVSQTLGAGDTLSLSVQATGGLNLAYQWMRNGVNISDATNSTLTITNVLRANAGSYVVTVTKDLATNSDPAIITILDPFITQQPVGGNSPIGTKWTWSIGANGTPIPGYATGLAYQWYFQPFGSATAKPLLHRTNATFTLITSAVTSAGSYFCIVTNRFLPGETVVPNANIVKSAVVTLTTYFAPTILRQPGNLTRTVGNDAQFTVVSSSSSAMSYQWNFNGVAISGATNTILTLSNVQVSDSGSYSCSITNELGAGTVTGVNHGRLVVKADALTPVSLITYPASSVTVANGSFHSHGDFAAIAPNMILSGRAVDDGLITNVTLTRIFPPWATNSWDVTTASALPTRMLWNTNITLVDGTNTFVATAADDTGKTNQSVARNIFLSTKTALTVNVIGTGKTSAATSKYGTPKDGALLDINRGYNIKAVATSNGVNFVNWTDGSATILSTDPLLHFTMTNGLILNANFDH